MQPSSWSVAPRRSKPKRSTATIMPTMSMRNTMLDRTNHNRLSEEATRRLADKYIPAAGREVERNDNNPPEPVADEAAIKAYATALMVSTPAIDAAKDHIPLLKTFIADHPVFQNAEE